MPLLGAFVFPPVDELFRWKDLVFNDTPLAINKTVLLVLISSAMILIFMFWGSRKMKLQPTGVQNVVEMTYEFIDNGITRDVVGHDAQRYTPFLGTLFLFILFLNIWEVIPGIQFPATSRLAIPLFLALVSWATFIVTGFVKQGPKYFFANINPTGVPFALKFLVVPIEFFSKYLVRPFSLAVRLFANMTAGHVLLAIFAIMTNELLIVHSSGLYQVIFAPLPFAGLVAFTGFELLVAVLQAYIFTILTAVYINESVHPEH